MREACDCLFAVAQVYPRSNPASGRERGATVWSAIGLAAAAAVAAMAWLRSARPHGFYDAGVYAMTARSHRRFAALSLAFAAFFVLALGLHRNGLGVGGLAIYAIAAVWYGASFLRGASDDDA